MNVRKIEESDFDDWNRLVSGSPEGQSSAFRRSSRSSAGRRRARFRIWRVERRRTGGGAAVHEIDSRLGFRYRPAIFSPINGIILRRYSTKYPSQQTARHLKILSGFGAAFARSGYKSVHAQLPQHDHRCAPVPCFGMDGNAELHLHRSGFRPFAPLGEDGTEPQTARPQVRGRRNDRDAGRRFRDVFPAPRGDDAPKGPAAVSSRTRFPAVLPGPPGSGSLPLVPRPPAGRPFGRVPTDPARPRGGFSYGHGRFRPGIPGDGGERLSPVENLSGDREARLCRKRSDGRGPYARPAFQDPARRRSRVVFLAEESGGAAGTNTGKS